LEVEGSRRRIADFYLPLLRKHQPNARRVLDAGCGNGVSVETLAEHGYDAWGNDLSELRAWQWRQRSVANRLLVANALTLPFPDAYFDSVISSGVIEHIGVAETSVPFYAVRALPDRDAQRLAFLRELARVVRPGGSLYVDAPNGAFPIDFWHSDAAGKPRFHALSEEFLPRYREIRALARAAMPQCRVAPVSPHKRLQFRQAGRHLHGKLLSPAADVLFRAMRVPGFRWLAGSAINPFLVVRIVKLV
jgi:SAM-dependent methyltransferase